MKEGREREFVVTRKTSVTHAFCNEEWVGEEKRYERPYLGIAAGGTINGKCPHGVPTGGEGRRNGDKGDHMSSELTHPSGQKPAG